MPDATRLQLMAGRVGIRSRAYALLLRGPAPSCLPPQGSVSPAIPLVRIPPAFPLGGNSSSHTFLALHGLLMAERVGFEPTVPLPRRMLSKHVDSSTLAPLHDRTTARGGILSRRLVGGKARGHPSRSYLIPKQRESLAQAKSSRRDRARSVSGLPPLTPFARIPILRDNFSGGM